MVGARAEGVEGVGAVGAGHVKAITDTISMRKNGFNHGLGTGT